MTSPRLEEYARRAKLPIRVTCGNGGWISIQTIDEVWYSRSKVVATRAYLQAVKELTE